MSQKRFTKIFITMLLLASLLVLGGCGMGSKKEKRLFNAMKENGFLDLECDYEDYDEVRQVSQSPVPAVTTYYDYSQDGVIYTIDYRSIILGQDDSVYQVRLSIKTESDTTVEIYYFEKDTFEFREKK